MPGERGQLRILHIEDWEPDTKLLTIALRRAGYDAEVRRVATASAMLAALHEAVWEVVISDYRLPAFDALEALAILHETGLDLPFIIVSGTIDEVEAVTALRAGAHDFITKAKLARLAPAIERERREAAGRHERVRAEALVRQQLEQLGALRAIDQAITSSLDLHFTLSVLLDQMTTQLGLDAADVLLLDPPTQTLFYAAGRGFRTRVMETAQLRVGDKFAGRAALERGIVEVEDLSAANGQYQQGGVVDSEAFVYFVGAPLIAKGNVVGLLEGFHRSRLAPDARSRSFLEALAGQAAIAVENALLFERLQRANVELTQAYDATIVGWSRALDLRDKETEGHSQRVTELTLRLARARGMSDAELVQVRRGALLHDIGKMGIPDRILLKPDKLTDDEWVIMRQHPTFAYELLSPITFLQPALDIPYCHHEKWDGTGYPRGLAGEAIPLAARLFAVVDVWDALRSNRPYRLAWPKDSVLQHIRSLAGSDLDPGAVATFLQDVLPDS